MMSFRKVSSMEAFNKTGSFLKSDVVSNGGSASEIINMHEQLVELTILSSPWGAILINKPISSFEAAN
jgi:hypothetical protein